MIVYIDNPGDKIIAERQGPYEIRSYIDYVLSTPARFAADNQYIRDSVANLLVLLGENAISGTGNVLDNILDGTQNGASNILSGGIGNDTYNVAGNDSVIENANEGTDTVCFYGITANTYTLSANVENLKSVGMWLNLIGNELSNTLAGDYGDNILDGGLAADSLNGMGGNDTYWVDNIGDVVIESVNAGIDTVNSIISYTLNANTENLTLVGTAAIDATGNELNNILTGNASNNTLTDFSVVDDPIKLENAIFTRFTTTGALAANQFVSAPNATALDSNDYLMYDRNNGLLYYDADGNGAGAQIAFAALTGIPSITAADIWII